MKQKEKFLAKINNAEAICVKIREEAASQSKGILEKAAGEAAAIIQQARLKSEAQKTELVNELKKELIKFEEKIAATLNLEKRKIVLREKRKFAEEIFAILEKESQGYRHAKEYLLFLKKAIMEGVTVIDDEQMDVIYSGLDAQLVSGDFIDKIIELARHKFNKNIHLTFRQGDFKDIGVIIQSQDGRRMYDNRFMQRLKRAYDEIYIQLLKEAF